MCVHSRQSGYTDTSDVPHNRRDPQSMNNKIEIYCRNARRYVEVEGGATLAEIARMPGLNLGFRPICALVNNKTEHLGFQVFMPKEIEFLDPQSPIGREVYVRSLCMMACRALREIDPSLTIRIEHSIARGLFCRVFDIGMNRVDITPDFVNSLLAAMRCLAVADIAFVRHEKLTSDVIEIFRRQQMLDKVRLLETVSEIYTSYYDLDGVADSFYGPLAPSTGMIRVFDMVPWQDGILMLGPTRRTPTCHAPR